MQSRQFLAFALLTPFAACAFDQFDNSVCEAVQGDANKITCFRDMGIASSCGENLDCYRSAAKSILKTEHAGPPPVKRGQPEPNTSKTIKNPKPPAAVWSEQDAVAACVKLIKINASFPSSVDTHDFFGIRHFTNPVTKIVVTRIDFDAKNGLGLPLPYTAICLFPPGEPGSVTFKNR